MVRRGVLLASLTSNKVLTRYKDLPKNVKENCNIVLKCLCLVLIKPLTCPVRKTRQLRCASVLTQYINFVLQTFLYKNSERPKHTERRLCWRFQESPEAHETRKKCEKGWLFAKELEVVGGVLDLVVLQSMALCCKHGCSIITWHHQLDQRTKAFTNPATQKLVSCEHQWPGNLILPKEHIYPKTPRNRQHIGGSLSYSVSREYHSDQVQVMITTWTNRD